ncbi:hypothetical protein [Pseudomonas sp. VI4.1]|uniref:hypothetical protein n=1 Tax=Pseudomonas sp. VI4.1 TaxID=1941346 RepID=UPI00100820A3|nr:hypothetical protein [Pseudomonas sp. VI4.1]
MSGAYSGVSGGFLRLNSLLIIDRRHFVSGEKPVRGLACATGQGFHGVERKPTLGRQPYASLRRDAQVAQDKTGAVNQLALGFQLITDVEGQGEIRRLLGFADRQLKGQRLGPSQGP